MTDNCSNLLAHLDYTDVALLKLLSQGDRSAFDTIFSRHWESLYKRAFFILKDEQASKDIVQDLFVWLWENRNQLTIQSPHAYLTAAVKFKVANYIRAGKIRDDFFEELAAVTTSSYNAEELAEIKELKQIIQTAVDKLPEKCREIFLLSRHHRLTNPEIASRLSLSIKTVENQMTIALRRIREATEPYLLLLFLVSLHYADNVP